MKKFSCVALAIIIALSCVVTAFAYSGTNREADSPYMCGICKSTFGSAGELNEHINQIHGPQYCVCPYCGSSFTDEYSYNDHIDICADQLRDGANTVSFSAIVDRLIRVFESGASWWDSIEDIIIRLIDVFEGIGIRLVPDKDVAEFLN